LQVCVRYVDSHGLISEAIKLETWSPFPHVEIMTQDGLGAFGSRSSGGVQIRHPDYEVFTKEERYWVEVDDAQGAEAWEWAHRQVGKPYDYTDIAGILFHQDWRSEGHWICSDLVARFFEKAGSPLLRINERIGRVTPGMTYLSTKLVDFGWKRPA
jgi:uncharacterized protein YycO